MGFKMYFCCSGATGARTSTTIAIPTSCGAQSAVGAAEAQLFHHIQMWLLMSLHSVKAFSRPIDTGCNLFTALACRQCTSYVCMPKLMQWCKRATHSLSHSCRRNAWQPTMTDPKLQHKAQVVSACKPSGRGYVPVTTVSEDNCAWLTALN